MNSLQTQTSSQHSCYEPFRWIFWVRIAQLVLTVVVMILCAYSVSQFWVYVPAAFSFWVVSWSIIYVPVVTWFMPRVSGKYRPNIIVPILEGFSCFWWFLTFIFLALFVSGTWALAVAASAASYGSGYDYSYRLLKRTPKYEVPSSNSGSHSSSDGVNTASDAVSNVMAAWGATKAAVAFAAINWALFVATFIAVGIKIHRQRRERRQRARASDEVNEAHGVAVESDKGPQVTTNSVPA